MSCLGLVLCMGVMHNVERLMCNRSIAEPDITQELVVIQNYSSYANLPSTWTERIDRIGKCHSGLWDTIISPRKTVFNATLASQR